MSVATKTQWQIDPAHSDVAFKVKHMMLSTVTGHFENFEGSIEKEGAEFKNLNVTVFTDSINTKNGDRDGHLKSNDFFNASEFPKMTFKSKSYKGEKLIGDLTIRDVTKEIVLETEFNGIAVDPYGQTKAGFELVGEINRKDFGLSWSAVTEAGNIVVSDKIKLVIDAQFIQQN